jgi:hypothetical protein
LPCCRGGGDGLWQQQLVEQFDDDRHRSSGDRNHHRDCYHPDGDRNYRRAEYEREYVRERVDVWPRWRSRLRAVERCQPSTAIARAHVDGLGGEGRLLLRKRVQRRRLANGVEGGTPRQRELHGQEERDGRDRLGLIAGQRLVDIGQQLPVAVTAPPPRDISRIGIHGRPGGSRTSTRGHTRWGCVAISTVSALHVKG